MKTTDESLKLRPLEPEDLDFLYSLENDSDMWLVSGTNVPYSKYSLTNYIMTNTSDIYTDKQVRLVMENSNGEPVGLLDIFNFDPRHLRAEIGIAVTKSQRHHGYGQIAVKKVIQYSKTILHLRQIYAMVDIDNTLSLKMFQSCGFSVGATLKDWVFIGNAFRDVAVLQLFL